MKINITIDKLFNTFLLAVSLVSLSSVFLIIAFISIKSIPFFFQYSFFDFVFGTVWAPSGENPEFGIFGFIVNSLLTTFVAVLLAIPFSIGTSIYISFLCSKKTQFFLITSIELLASIPSVIFGFLGVVLLAPFMRMAFPFSGNTGFGMLSSSIILAIMILPTMTSISITSFTAVDQAYIRASFALGASLKQTIYRCIIPTAKTGVFTGIILANGRALGETIALQMIAGNSIQFISSPFSSIRTLTTNIVSEMSYASGTHEQALFATALILFFFILSLNLIINIILKPYKKNYKIKK